MGRVAGAVAGGRALVTAPGYRKIWLAVRQNRPRVAHGRRAQAGGRTQGDEI